MNKTITYILPFICILGSLFSSIDDCLKPITDKPDAYYRQLPNIDFIYTINLDKRPEKFAHCVQELAPYGIIPYRFSAVNGWEIPLEEINDLGVKYESWMPKDLWGTCFLLNNHFQPHHEIMSIVGRNYFHHHMSRGAIGICLSHLSILQDAFNSNYDTIWVMEDDIEVIQDPRLIPYVIEELDSLVGADGWDILFTDQDTKNQKGEYVICQSFARRPNFTPKNPSRFAKREQISENFRKIGARYGSYSMIIRRSGVEKILKHMKTYNIFLPFDMEFNMSDDIHFYTVVNDIVSTLPQALSDNGAPNYHHKTN